MSAQSQQTALLRRGTYPIHPAARLEDQERDLLARFGFWLEALAKGEIAPTTPEQVQFVCVARGEMDPHTAFEKAWVKHQQMIAQVSQCFDPMEVSSRFEHLQVARQAAATVREEYESCRAAILKQIDSQLDKLETEFADRLRISVDQVEALEAKARESVLALGASFRHAGVRAVYMKPRVSWDSKGLREYAQTHPDIEQFRRVGKPSVSLRFDAAPEPANAESVPPGESR